MTLQFINDVDDGESTKTSIIRSYLSVLNNEAYVIVGSLQSDPMGKLMSRIPGLRLLISYVTDLGVFNANQTSELRVSPLVKYFY